MQNKAEATNTPRRGFATWPSAPDVVPIPRDEVRVFLVNLHGSGSLPRHKSLLSSDEIDRANSYAQTRDRDRFIARRGFLRELVAGYTGIKSAHIGLQYSASGRPHLSEEWMKDFDVSAEPGQAPTLLADRTCPSEARLWSFSLLDLGVHWRAVVVTESRNLSLRCWTIDKV